MQEGKCGKTVYESGTVQAVTEMFGGQSLPRPGQKAQVSEQGIIRSTDGKYRWVYEVNQWKDRTALVALTAKYALVGLGIGMLFWLMKMAGLLLVPALAAGGAVLALASHAVGVLTNGATYCILFTLDGQTVRFQQVEGRSSREKVMQVVSEWVGGQSYPELTFKAPVEIPLSQVTRIRPDIKRNRICVGGIFAQEQIYADPGQFDFVLGWLKQQCPQAKIKA